MLKDYFPQARDLTGKELYARLACDFLLKWPTLQALQRANREVYDESTYLRALERAKSPLVEKIRELKLQRGLKDAA